MAKADDKTIDLPTAGGSYVVSASGKLERQAFTKPAETAEPENPDPAEPPAPEAPPADAKAPAKKN